MKTSSIRHDILAKLGLEGNFSITNEVLDSFDKAYCPEGGTSKPGEIRFNRKMSALNLLKHKRTQGVPARDIKEGFIYIVSNPSWSAYKVGVSLEPRDRLKQYQTGCPNRDYVLEGWYFSRDARKLEKELHEKLRDFHVGGEWLSLDLNNLRKFLIRKTDL